MSGRYVVSSCSQVSESRVSIIPRERSKTSFPVRLEITRNFGLRTRIIIVSVNVPGHGKPAAHVRPNDLSLVAYIFDGRSYPRDPKVARPSPSTKTTIPDTVDNGPFTRRTGTVDQLRTCETTRRRRFWTRRRRREDILPRTNAVRRNGRTQKYIRQCTCVMTKRNLKQWRPARSTKNTASVHIRYRPSPFVRRFVRRYHYDH